MCMLDTGMRASGPKRERIDGMFIRTPIGARGHSHLRMPGAPIPLGPAEPHGNVRPHPGSKEHGGTTTMSRILRGVAAGWGAKKLGGGCVTTILVFVLLWWLLGNFGVFQ